MTRAAPIPVLSDRRAGFDIAFSQFVEPGDRQIQWLARTNAIASLPTVPALASLRRVARPSAASRPMIGVGNPLLKGSDGDEQWATLARERRACDGLRITERIPRSNRAVRSPNADLRAAALDLDLLRAQPPLPETADELCAAAKAFDAASDDVLLGSRATETNIKRLSRERRLADYRVVHFATHGVLEGQLGKEIPAGLILTPPQLATPEDDGYLTSAEIAALKLDAEWVILSACNTGVNNDVFRIQLSPLSYAFISAGARSVLVSHWAVDSDASVKLMTGAVQLALQGSGMPRVEALRLSMLSMIDHGKPYEVHPAFWAPFTLVGDSTAAP